MRRNCRGSSLRMATAFTHRVGPAVISVALLLGTPGLAKADPDTMAKLIADVAQANQRLQDLNAQIQTEEESVNKAVVDVETARDNATASTMLAAPAAVITKTDGQPTKPVVPSRKPCIACKVSGDSSVTSDVSAPSSMPTITPASSSR